MKTRFTSPDPDFQRRMRSSFSRQGFLRHLGVKMIDLQPGYCEMEVVFGDQLSQQHGYYHGGLVATLDAVYWQLWDVDLREQAPRLDVPVYFLEGRHDVNAPPALAEDYLQKLAAPHKELIWFEHSGHSPWVDEADKVVDVMVNKVLAGATP